MDYKLPLSSITLNKGTLNIGYNIQVNSKTAKLGADSTSMTTPRPMIEKIRAYATSTKKSHIRTEYVLLQLSISDSVLTVRKENLINFTPYKGAEIFKADAALLQGIGTC
jgi:hypothetical protein